MDPKEIKRLIEAGLPGARAEVRTDGQGHYEAVVVSSAFEGEGRVRRHQLVYQTLGARVGTDIHALALKTFTPGEWQA
ncbi:MAG: BolA/IbaG family iron-sulfur metabolism protein [Rhodospirillaceae bacterium]|nr:BolA/IbaG family iron-sulfur metabolism protein [Rhodospirillaceae bacterium]